MLKVMVLMIGEEFEIKVFFCAMQDSPVFSYICNLSPIKTIKPIPITCPLSSLNYASPPSVFTSPHAVSHKESRFRRYNQSLFSSESFLVYSSKLLIGMCLVAVKKMCLLLKKLEKKKL